MFIEKDGIHEPIVDESTFDIPKSPIFIKFSLAKKTLCAFRSGIGGTHFQENLESKCRTSNYLCYRLRSLPRCKMCFPCKYFKPKHICTIQSTIKFS